MIIWLVFILVASWIIWSYLARDGRKVKLSKQFDGPLAIPVLGNLYMYANKKPEGELRVRSF